MKKLSLYIVIFLSVLSTKALALSKSTFYIGEAPVSTLATSKAENIRIVLKMQHISQPNYYTCGATVLAMQTLWETSKHYNPIQYDVESVYDYVNKYDEKVGNKIKKGLTTSELKEGYEKLFKLTNMWLHMEEDGYNSISDSLEKIKKQMLINKSPATIYGNIKNGGAGGHYYLAKGVVDCPKRVCGSRIQGAFLADSVYGAGDDVFSSESIVENAVNPYEFVDIEELKFYWKPTGSPFSIFRKHYFLYNVNNYE